ncbi:MAG: hypothetical protein AB8F95_18560 [Bacteroidia bacterium]
MQKVYLMLFAGLLLAACTQGDSNVKAAQKAAYSAIESIMPNIDVAPGDTLACESLAFGPEVSSGPSVLPLRRIQDAIPKDMQKEAGFWMNDENGESIFDSLSIYYGLGKMAFGEGKTAILVGRHRTERHYSAHLFVYDKVNHAFVGTQSLQFILEGGNYKGSRDAWITDLNNDGTPDIVYNFSASFESEDPSLTYAIRDSIHAEIWTGNTFANLPLENINMIREAMGLPPTGDSDIFEESSEDEFF